MPINRNFQGQTYSFPDGTTDQQIENYFTKISEPKEKRGLLKDYNYLQTGLFKPYFPGKGTQEAFFDLSRRTGQPNIFKESLSILKAMNRAFSKQRIDKDWQFKLEDFLPAADPQSRIPLPEQPQPNPAIVQQPTPMTTGLTPAEQTLLSEEEKMIRLRNRGLA